MNVSFTLFRLFDTLHHHTLVLEHAAPEREAAGERENMRAIDVVQDLLNNLETGVREEIVGLTPDQLRWRPQPEANSIGVTVWHCTRWLDVLATQILGDRPSDDELWFREGWAERTAHDPRGRGYRGLGVITGYSQDDVATVPELSAADFLLYFGQVCSALKVELAALPNGDMTVTASGHGGGRSVYARVTPLLQGCFGHLGEIAALRAMQARVTSGE
jgi:hypothetical protein